MHSRFLPSAPSLLSQAEPVALAPPPDSLVPSRHTPLTVLQRPVLFDLAYKRAVGALHRSIVVVGVKKNSCLFPREVLVFLLLRRKRRLRSRLKRLNVGKLFV